MNYPFSALVGQEEMKLALILSVINPNLGGVLIRGEKGTAKSTAVRALSALLPQQKIVEGCSLGCDPNDNKYQCEYCASLNNKKIKNRPRPLVELPLGATEDRLLGSINIEKAITQGSSKFEPGLLAEAHRGILYVDEVNLLDDHLVDSFLDAAAMGQNIVEREGISISHPTSFSLIGTMNPEEGELRPQLLDRFGLCVEVKGLEQSVLRNSVIKRRLEFEQNPEDFNKKFESEDKKLSKKIEKSSLILPSVTFSDEIIDYAVKICLSLGVDGHRGDLTIIKTALTLAAFNEKSQVDLNDVIMAAELSLPHRMRRKPFQEVDFNVKNRIVEANLAELKV
ncbi:MAG: ATP-binding protein [Candidatus Adiutrix sp.]